MEHFQLTEKTILKIKESNITKWTSVQEKAIPAILEGKDVVVQSPTGTGKTLAYVLPLLKLIDENEENPQVVIMAPTRELVMQIFQVVQDYTQNTNIKVASIVGGADVKRQVEKLKQKPKIIVGSPGRISQLIKLKKLKMHGVKKIVFDEVDELIKTDDQKDLPQIVKATLKDRQLLFFSATITPQAMQFAKEQSTNLTEITVDQSLEGNIMHGFIPCEEREKLELLRRIGSIQNMKALVFSNDPFKLEGYASKLNFRGIKTAVLHSKLGKMERSKVLKDLQSGKTSLLFSTDVAARGIDLQDLPYVVTLDVPEKVEQYTHRSGRVGRMGNQGTVINLVTPREKKHLFTLRGTQKLFFEQLSVTHGEVRKVEMSEKVEDKVSIENNKKLPTNKSPKNNVKKIKKQK
ncbi:DEAD/DEAH box helicase [Gottfriedia solisilvae]|uniref:DEAD-box ATP-dependent RNA helicase CshC n=1 Tax=Gottfriedia solisilvae TaxID=1516104 RepID=A0A8J3ADS6_9BACI|nr:DEAD/DEAH box helicase [Gottfriedia solisilvae]GGI12433.1 DEAD-box ATP-dependent RNA helicase CshC [Gottfriedia solisilvae]